MYKIKAIEDAVLEERERIKKIVRDSILHTLVPNSATISIDKFIQNLNNRIDNKPDREKCKTCEHAYFGTTCDGGVFKDGKMYNVMKKDEYPSHCGYGLDGAVEIDDDFTCPKEK